jgi:hypothetical protein
MAKLLLKRTLSGWTEADDESKALARKFVVGQTYRANISKPRELVSLRRYWGLVTLILDNSPQFTSKEQIHNYLKIRAGHCTPIVSKSTGEIFLVPNSIDFDSLDETQFQAVWNKVVDVVCEEILPGVSQDEINLEIQKCCGIAA